MLAIAVGLPGCCQVSISLDKDLKAASHSKPMPDLSNLIGFERVDSNNWDSHQL